MKILPADSRGLSSVLQDYRERGDPSEAAVLNSLMGALASGGARALAAVEADRVVGAAILSRRKEQGEIHFLHALPGAPAGTIRALLEQAEIEMNREGGLARISATLALLPGLSLEEPFRQLGYHVFPRARMVVEPARLAPPRLPSEYRFISWEPNRTEEAVALMAAAHEGLEDALLYPELAGPSGVRHLLEQVGAGLFGRFEASLSPMVLGGDQLAGLCLALWHVAHPQQGFIADLCVGRAHRRRGLGQALVCQTGHAFHRAGAELLGLAVTLSNQAALRLYQDLGFHMEQPFAVFVHEPGGAV